MPPKTLSGPDPLREKENNRSFEWYINTSKHLARTFFREDGLPVELTEGQAEIFAAIYFKINPRVCCICCTQYGKSWTIGLATTLRSIACKEKFIITAPSDKQAGITMNYVLEHSFDTPEIAGQLAHKKETLQRLQDEKSKKKLTFLHGGSIEILTLNAVNTKRSKEAAMGFGSPNIIFDEAPLVPDELEATVVRMLGGKSHNYDDTFLMKIGNPFYRNHFKKSWDGNRYHKIFIDYHRALREGRYSQQFIDEMREKPFFSVYYQCKFPDADEIDAKGFRQLIPESLLDAAYTPDKHFPSVNGGRIGVDVGAGGDETVYTTRNALYARIVSRNISADTMVQVNEMRRLKEELEVESDRFAVDDGSIGHSVVDRCHEKEDLERVQRVGFGQRPSTEEKRTRFKNMRAEMYFGLLDWLKAGGRLPESQRDDFKPLLELRYKQTTDDKILLMEKSEWKKKVGHSPDACDSFALTFAPEEIMPTFS